MKDGKAFKKNKSGQLLYYLPSEMIDNIIRPVHEKFGHFGSTKCYEQLRLHYWFPEM